MMGFKPFAPVLSLIAETRRTRRMLFPETAHGAEQ